jgi:hypothetical protein
MEIGAKISKMALVLLLGLVEIVTKANGKIMNLMVKVLIDGQMVVRIQMNI